MTDHVSSGVRALQRVTVLPNAIAISAARASESLLPIWLRLLQKLGTANFNFKIAR